MEIPEKYSIIQIANDALDDLEQIGTKTKYWYEDEKKLFKKGRSGTGENWSEKVASELANLLQLPHVHYDFACCKNELGVVSNNFVPKKGRLVHGNELLAQIDKTYPVSQCHKEPYTISTVISAIQQESAKVPLSSPPLKDIDSAVDVFVGYLLLDAWIGNQDRHDQNWGLIYIEENSEVYLTPTFDHASSLGRNENDQRRKQLLESTDNKRNIENYVKRARSPFYNCNKPPKRLKTIDAFIKAATLRPKAGMIWLNQLDQTQDIDLTNIMHRIPNELISKESIDFAVKMLNLNKKRLLKQRGILQ
ncbi:MAG: hypothetical protein PVI90_16025 [Desulfobacteraceae bacterium]|jgi:hypothetical protein